MDDMTSSFPIINKRYQIHKTIASGGMAVIYLAQDLLLERRVALKVLRKDFSDNQEFQNSFRAEAKASARLSHPNIVTTYDFGYDADRLYIVLELVEGQDLKSIITSKEPLLFSQSKNFLLQAGKGLGYAHRSGFVHCDAKPQNMLVSKEGILKITDFGIARALDTISHDERYDVVWGSPYYISPEQARGLPPSPATDIYSLGIIAYEMFTGELPFDAEDSAELARKHREEIPRPPKALNPAMPDDLNNFVLKAIEKDPRKRFKDGNAFVETLKYLEVSADGGIFLRANNVEQEESQLELRSVEEISAELDKEQQPTWNWQTILLSFLALILGGGLIPFWIYVLFTINR